MIKDPAIGGMWAAVDVENEWVLLLRIEVGRLLNPPLNVLAVEAAVIDFLWRGQIQLRPKFPVEVSNILGAGDAFASGFLYGFVKGWDWYRTARLANACGAIVVTRHGCANFMPTYDEVNSFIEQHGGF